MAYTTEIVRVVWDDKDGVSLSIGPDSDSLGLVEMRTTDTKSAEFYGKVRLCMPKEMAIAVGEALIAAAEETGAV